MIMLPMKMMIEVMMTETADDWLSVKNEAVLTIIEVTVFGMTYWYDIIT